MRLSVVVTSMLIAACEPPPAPTGARVLIATADLPPGHVLVAGDLQPADLPKTHATPGAARPEELDALIGRQLRVRLERGATILRSATRPPERSLRPDAIAENRRALTMPIAGADQLDGVHQVDLVIELDDPRPSGATTADARIRRRMSRLRVLSVLRPVAPEQPSRVTLEMLPEEAEIVAQAMEVGTLRVEPSSGTANVKE